MSDTEQLAERGTLGTAIADGGTVRAMREPTGEVWVQLDDGWSRANPGSRVAESFHTEDHGCPRP